jgi:hypothetical protein
MSANVSGTFLHVSRLNPLMVLSSGEVSLGNYMKTANKRTIIGH